MPPLPDDFNTAAFDAAYGTPAYDIDADERALANRKAAAILHRARAEIVALGNFEWAATGYDLVDALDLLDDLTPKVA